MAYLLTLSSVKIVALSTAAMMGLAGIASAQSSGSDSSSLGSSTGSGCPPVVVVTPENNAGWFSLDARPPTFVEGPAGASPYGSIELKTHAVDTNDRVNYA